MTTGATPPALANCPWCNKALFRGRSKINPYAVCRTEECFGAKMPVVNLDVPSDVTAYNRRASGTEAALREALAKIKHSIVHAVGTGKPKAVKAFEEIWTLADDALASPPRDGDK